MDRCIIIVSASRPPAEAAEALNQIRFCLMVILGCCLLVALLMDLRAQFIQMKSFSLVLDSFFYECSLTLSASSDSAYRSLTKPGRDAIRAG